MIYFPGSGALFERSIEGVDRGFRDLVLRSGRAFVFPIYKGMFERRDGRSLNEYHSAKNDFRVIVIQWSKDLGRTIDYLETRTGIQRDKLAYCGFSLGGPAGFVLTAVEPRLKACILAGQIAR